MLVYHASMSAALPDLLTPRDVALWLSLPTRRVERMARRGVIPCTILPTDDVVFDADELAEWFKGLRGDKPEPSTAGEGGR